MNEFSKPLADAIKRARGKLKLTQEQVAELAEAVRVKLTAEEMRRLEEAAAMSGAKVLGHDLFRFAVLKKRSSRMIGINASASLSEHSETSCCRMRRFGSSVFISG